MTARRALVVTTAIVIAAGVAGCSGSSSSTSTPIGTTSSTSSTSSTSPSTPAQPAPAATESNPPGDIPDNQAFVAYAPAGQGFSVKVPEGWARTTKAGVTTFTDKLNRIEVTSAAASSAPTVQSVTETVVPAVKQQVPKFSMGKVTTVSRNAGKAVLLTYQGDSAPDQVTGKVVRDAFQRYMFFKNGRMVTLTLVGPTNADNVDPWRIVSDSLRWV